MKKLFTILTASVVGMSMMASPATIRFERESRSVSAELNGRGDTNGLRPTMKSDNFTLSKAVASTVRNAPQPATQDLGIEQAPLLFEDFSKMTTGSIEAPDYATNIYLEAPEYPWHNMMPEFTLTPGWGSDNAAPAGGAILMNMELNGYSRLTTPLMDMSGFGGVATVRVKARTLEGEAFMGIESLETFNMSDGEWRYMESTEVTVTPEWQTFELTIQNGGPTSMFNIYSMVGSDTEPRVNIYIDEVTVVQYDLYVGVPVGYPHTNYTENSFDISWSAADKAESYLVDVYTMKQADYWSDPVYEYLYQEEPVAGTSWTVEDIVPGETYYYCVRAVNGEHVSMASVPVIVFDIVSPVLGDVAGISDEGVYTANWSNVPSAEAYHYWAYCDRVAAEAGEFVVTNENFDGVTDNDGNLTGWTKEEPSYLIYSEADIKCTTQAGWIGTNYAPYTDYICLDVWHYLVGGGDSAILSPELDLSKDGGKVRVSVGLCSEEVQMWNPDNTTYMAQVGCAVALFNYDETVGDFVQSELIYVDGITFDWQEFEINLTTGTERSIIGLYGVTAPGNLYIDDLLITQNYEAGDMLREPFLWARYYEQPLIEVTIPERAADMEIWHKVSAVKSRVVDLGWTQETVIVESDFTDLKHVGRAPMASVESHSLQYEAYANVKNGELRVLNPAQEAIVVYDLAGNLIYSDNSGSERVNVELPVKGIYVVKVGEKAMKVIR